MGNILPNYKKTIITAVSPPAWVKKYLDMDNPYIMRIYDVTFVHKKYGYIFVLSEYIDGVELTFIFYTAILDNANYTLLGDYLSAELYSGYNGLYSTITEVTVDNGSLIIKGEVSTEESGEALHKGIATRKFTRSFALGEFMEVTGAEFKNGMLAITVERIVPEEKKPKSIKIK